MELSVQALIFLFSTMLIIGVLATKFSTRLGLPSLVLFLLLGMFLNNYIFFENAKLSQLIGIVALIIILFEGGTQTKWGNIRPVLGAAGSLATIGVLITTVVTGLAAMYILDLSLLEGMLFGSIVGSTDAAAVFSVLGNKNIKRRITSTLEAESGTNDPMAVFLTVTLIEVIQLPDSSIWTAIGSFFWQMGIGLVIGILLGKATTTVINKITLDASGLYPVLALACAIFTYAFTSAVGGSGLLAVYVMAVYIGNNDLMYRFSILRFNEGFAWMMQIIMFILLGLLVFPEQLLEIFWQGLLLSMVLMFIARPIGVFLSMLFMKYTGKEKTFISWAGLKGAVPVILATYPTLAGVENSQLIFNVVFFVVLTSALIQGSSLSWLGSKLKLTETRQASPFPTMELITLGRSGAEIMEATISEDTPATGVTLEDLTLPEETLITAIIREGKVITPTGSSVLQTGDTLYVLTHKKQRDQVRALLFGKKKPKRTEEKDERKAKKAPKD
ncbi:potassium/proton antiporter [Sediminibacillus halophilus]|uniref:Cell volume regulation protein A n=1 Tax=Sediminibacillus halophilus TaxID=482461 RepID=A0A1G9NYY2_9BACI|nr:potassium/proton antiporter [Sediminibacillus halophilus]SDL91227.1 cell volume regulation protein A [Sediminibacillus halophilus]